MIGERGERGEMIGERGERGERGEKEENNYSRKSQCVNENGNILIEQLSDHLLDLVVTTAIIRIAVIIDELVTNSMQFLGDLRL